MDVQSANPDPHPASPAAARAALHEIIDKLTDAEVTSFWRLVCTWVVDSSHQPSGSP